MILTILYLLLQKNAILMSVPMLIVLIITDAVIANALSDFVALKHEKKHKNNVHHEA